MYLKSLELQGFKSFPDKVKLTFDKGLTAVVGPNGSGKSNIGDSVRWVLGEQSTKTLRGNKMEDVIFSGTVARKPVGFAMVTLVIDNGDRALNSDDDEVSVTRKLYRSGESEYKINGKNVRLKDINELFMDTGMGRDGYSIIGQGRIAEIVSAKSNERRDIFEEAAGISKFRYKKSEAERKLAAAQDNLIRLNDIVSELESRVGPLRLQAEKAEKFVALAQQRKTLEISVWVNRLEELKAKLEELENALLMNKNEYENIQNDIEREEQKIQEGYRKIQESSASIEELRDKILENEQLSAQYKSDIAVSENDISHSEGSLSSVNEQLKNRSAYEEKLKADISQKLELIDRLKKQSKEIGQKLDDVRKKFEEAKLEAESIGKNSDKAGNEINALYIKLSEFRSEVGNTDAIVKDTDEQLEMLIKQKNQVNELVLQYGKEKEEISDGLKVLEEKKREFSNKKAGLAKLYNDKAAKLSECRKECENILFSVKEKEQRKKLLYDLENNMEGFARSVKEIIKASSAGRIGGIRGTVAQLINVKQEYATAIETALGGAMQNIIVDDDTAAKRCIRMLKEQRLGRATFLPITSVKGRVLNEPGLQSEQGFISLANELVEYDGQYTSIVNSLLGRTAVADDIDSAAVIAKKFGYKFRVVTLDGQVVNAGGSFTGGSAVHSAGVFSRKNELESIEKDIKELNKKHSEAMELSRKLSEDAEKLSKMAKELDEEVSVLEQDKIKFDAEYSRVCALEKQTASQEEDFDVRYKTLEGKKQNALENRKNAKERLEEITGQIHAAEENLAREQGRRESVRNKRESLSAELSELKIKSAELSKDLEAAQREHETLNSGLLETRENLSSLGEEKKRLEQVIAEKTALISERKQQTEDIKIQIENFGNDIKKWQNVHREQDVYVTNLRNSVKELNEAKEKYSGEISKIDERKLSAQRDYDGIINQLYEVYEMTRSEAENAAEKIEDLMAAQRKLNELKAKIRSLGNVNVGAIDEYKEVSERYKFLSEQLADVRNSKRELEKLIADLTEDMCRIFAESFVIINNNFKKIFTELFGGGKAELILTDPENVLESGIEIRVAPPGKVIKNLISLSGGEQSFVAICIYFAILKLRPAPFCILDEIDAALDEVNVKKYAQYLKNFTDKTQFVLVTHRRSAMEEANVLYGVTMQEDGISRLLKMEQVDIEDTASK
ncbi:chromosome segregation protein SMC [Porcipelethomonas sp.]|uniref:chromosome segregation protein SMC n=1 Tax=Porcipelethomonas sp. TaxID=2981675 RepID=UPI003EFA75E5